MGIISKIQMRRVGSRGPVEMSCDRCGKLFNRPKNNVLGKMRKKGFHGKFYCSGKCSIEAHSLPIRKCKQCGAPTKTNFCSSKCSAQFNNRRRKRKDARPIKLCGQCTKETTNPKFCSQNCSQIFRERKYIEDWRVGKESGLTPSGTLCKQVRHYIFKKYGRKCARCGWCDVNPTSRQVPVQIEHIDGDFRNCSEKNLIVLCPNCHSLTPTYMGLNRGRGRGVNGVRRKKKDSAGIVQRSEYAPGTGETGVKLSIPAPNW